jgi:hypothetical protein
MFSVPTVIALSTRATAQTQLALIISDGSNEVARLVLPLVWFPVNRVVTHAFPMITRRQQDDCPMLLLDIHISSGRTPAFAVPLGKLKVVPTWTVPESMQIATVEGGGGQNCPLRVPISSLMPQEVIDAQQQVIARGDETE